MKRFLLSAVAGLALGLLLTGTASADGPAAPAPMGAAPVNGVVSGNCGGGCGFAHHDSRFGWNPLLRKLAFWKRDNGCGTCGDRGGLLARLRGLSPFGGGCGAGGCGGNAPAFNPYPNGVPGTLVFPQHPYVRSPRDFFMLDAR